MEEDAHAIPLQEANTLRLLDNIPIFSGIGIHEQHLVERRCHVEQVAADEIVIEQDDISNNLYIIIKGTVIVSKKSPSRGWVRINTLGKGDYFGEIALLRNIRRTARVTTQTPCTFLVIGRDDFLDIYKLFPTQARDNIQLVVAKRLAELSSRGV